MDKEFVTKTGSKSNLNESNIPLLEDDVKTNEKEEKIEMETKLDTDKDETKDESLEDGKLSKKEKKKKEKKEKKEKEKKEKKDKEKKERKSPSTCAQMLTQSLNVLDRDENNVNNHVNLVFEDIIAEPDSNHGFEFFWRLSFLLFNNVRHWVYCLLAALFALPLAIVWGLLFALINLFTIWFLTPVSKVFDIVVYHIHKYWNGLVRCVLDPFFASASLVLAKGHTKSDTQETMHP